MQYKYNIAATLHQLQREGHHINDTLIAKCVILFQLFWKSRFLFLHRCFEKARFLFHSAGGSAGWNTVSSKTTFRVSPPNWNKRITRILAVVVNECSPLTFCSVLTKYEGNGGATPAISFPIYCGQIANSPRGLLVSYRMLTGDFRAAAISFPFLFLLHSVVVRFFLLTFCHACTHGR